jgi:hypothetical protein
MVLSKSLCVRRNGEDYDIYILWTFYSCCGWLYGWVQYKRTKKIVRSNPHNVSNIIYSYLYIYKELLSKMKVTVLTIVTKLRTGQLRNLGSVWFLAGPRGFWLLQSTQTRSAAIHSSVEWYQE